MNTHERRILHFSHERQHNLKRPAYAHGPLALLNRKALEQFDADLLEKVVLDPQRDAVDKLNLKRPAYAHGPSNAALEHR